MNLPEQTKESPQEADSHTKEQVKKPVQKNSKSSSFTLILLIIFFLLLFSGLGAGGYYGWIFYQQLIAEKTSIADSIQSMQTELSQKAARKDFDQLMSELTQQKDTLQKSIKQLKLEQQTLLESTEQLYDLYGRDENGWKLAEVEYLLSVAQHRLSLENDFEGAATTLDAASQRIAQMGDPGLLPVRVKINDEIALLKTRSRPDLVGMTLLTGRLIRQLATLQPGFQRQPEPETDQTEDEPETITEEPGLPLQQQAMNFVKSLVRVKKVAAESLSVEPDEVRNIAQELEESLKLTRWAILERDGFQYQKLMQQNLQLFADYYDLNQPANHDFYLSLQKLQKSQIRPELPDINGSLQLLREIKLKRATTQEGESS